MHSGDLQAVIHDAQLPFEVELPTPLKTFDRIVNRNGHNLEAIKQDPDFNFFLESLLASRGSKVSFDARRPKAPFRPNDFYDTEKQV